MKKIILFVTILTVTHAVQAVNSVNPTGVNVNATGVTSVFLTFQGTQNQQSNEAFWCGQINVPANTVTNTNPCVPGTLLGFLPQNLDLSQSELGNLTDIMTIPASVSRKAMQRARSGLNSSFFYVRKFTSNGATQYIAVTCRMAGGGARVPFALTEVKPYFKTGEKKVGVHLLARGEVLPAIHVDIHYNGSGRLKGRWEIVKPGDALPQQIDLLPESSLPVTQRGLQKRYAVLENIDVFLPPTGTAVISGPKVTLLPNDVIGPYQILFRVEATRDKEGNSETGVGTVVSGGVAGFSMPVLRYYVASEDDVSETLRDAGLEKTLRLLPVKARGEKELFFNWIGIKHAAYYKFELKTDGEDTFVAIRKSGLDNYLPPPWIQKKLVSNVRSVWRVSAYNNSGKRIGRSAWQGLIDTD